MFLYGRKKNEFNKYKTNLNISDKPSKEIDKFLYTLFLSKNTKHEEVPIKQNIIDYFECYICNGFGSYRDSFYLLYLIIKNIDLGIEKILSVCYEKMPEFDGYMVIEYLSKIINGEVFEAIKEGVWIEDKVNIINENEKIAIIDKIILRSKGYLIKKLNEFNYKNVQIFDVSKNYGIVRKVVHKEDPYGLLECGCPKDEFDDEIKQITNEIKEGQSLEELYSIVKKTFVVAFDDKKEFTDDKCFGMAKQIYAGINGIDKTKSYLTEYDDLTGTCYFELSKGKYTSKSHWKKDSLFFTEDNFYPFYLIFSKRCSLDWYSMQAVDKRTGLMIADDLVNLSKLLECGKNFKQILEGMDIHKLVYANSQDTIIEEVENRKDEMIFACLEIAQWITQTLNNYNFFCVLGI